MAENKLSKEITDKINQMPFRELKVLIENCLKSKDEIDFPESFNILTKNPDVLREYTKILESKIILLPALPTFDDLKFTELEGFTVEIEKTKKKMNQAYYELKTAERKNNWRLAEKCKKRFDSIKTEIENIEKSAKYLKLLKAKQQKIIEYKIYLRKKEIYQSKLETFKIQQRILQRLRGNIEDLSRLNFQLTELNWKLLPSGEMAFSRLKFYLSEISKIRKNEFDYEKIEKIISLKADKIYYGIDEFEGYLVFYFENIKTAVLDCPIKGNAIYIFGEDWKNLSRLSKSKLLNYFPNKTKRIIHRGDWFEKLKFHLKTSDINIPHKF